MSGPTGFASGGEDDFNNVYGLLESTLGVGPDEASSGGVGAASAGAGSAASLGAGLSATYFANLLNLKPVECKTTRIDLDEFAKHLDVLANNGIEFTHSFRPLCTERYRGLLPDDIYEKLLSSSQSIIILMTLIADVLGNEISREKHFLFQHVSSCRLPESFDNFRLAEERFCGFNVLHLAVLNLNSDAAVLYLNGLIEIFPGLMTVKREGFDFAPTPLALLQSLAHNNAGLPGSKYAQQVLAFYVEYLQGQVSKETKSRRQVEDNLRAMTAEVEKYKADSSAVELLGLSGSGAGARGKKKKKPKKKKAPRAKAPETDAASHTTVAVELEANLVEKNAVIRGLRTKLTDMKKELEAALNAARQTSVKVGTKSASKISSLKRELSSLEQSNQELKTQNNKLVAKLDNLRSELAKSTKEKVGLPVRLDKAINQRPAVMNPRELAASKALAESKKTIAELVGKMGNLNSEVASLSAQIEVEKTKSSVFSSEIKNLNRWIIALNGQIQFVQDIWIGERANRVGLESFTTRLQQAYSKLASQQNSYVWYNVRPPLPPKPASAESAAAAPPEAPQSDAAASADPMAPAVAALFMKAKAKAKASEGSGDPAAGSASP